MCYTISEIKEKSVPIAKKSRDKKMSMFGSYARGEADNNSDIDILKKIIKYCDDVEELMKE